MVKKVLIAIVATAALAMVAYPLLARSFRAGYGPGGGQGRYIGSPTQNYRGTCQGYGGSSWGRGMFMNRSRRGMGSGWHQRDYPRRNAPDPGYPDGRDWSNRNMMVSPIN